MRFMILGYATEASEAGTPPSTEAFAEMGKYLDEIVKAGVLLDAQGLLPTARGARVTCKSGQRIVTDGPFTEAKELVAGFTLIQVKSKEEAIEWVKRAPYQEGTTVEIRQVFEPEDFGPTKTAEQHADTERRRAEVKAQHG